MCGSIPTAASRLQHRPELLVFLRSDWRVYVRPDNIALLWSLPEYAVVLVKSKSLES